MPYWLEYRPLAHNLPYAFKRGLPANEETIRQARDATDMRRAVEAYKFFFPTVATEAVAYAQKLKAYPLSEAGQSSSYRIVDVEGKKAPLPMLRWEKSMDYWRQLHAVVDSEVAQERHRAMLGMLAALGIKKGEPFQPNKRVADILTKAAEIGFTEMNVAFFANPRPERLIWEGRRWEYIPLMGPLDPATNDFGNENYRDLLAHDHYFFMAWGTSGGIGRRKAGNGSMYFYTARRMIRAPTWTAAGTTSRPSRVLSRQSFSGR